MNNFKSKRVAANLPAAAPASCRRTIIRTESIGAIGRHAVQQYATPAERAQWFAELPECLRRVFWRDLGRLLAGQIDEREVA